MLQYSERAKHCTNPTAKTLLTLMEEKHTNLCVAADFIKKSELLQAADIFGPEICVLKTHIDIVEDFDQDCIIELQRLSEKHHFLLFEDRKFADIGNTVVHQYQHGVYHIADWAHITNAHTVAGPGTIEGLQQVGLHRGRGLLLLAEMTPKGNLATGLYTQASIEMAKANRDFVIGFITTRKLIDDLCFINFTPGVQLTTGKDALGQRYTTPEQVIQKNGTDIIIVGRGIYGAQNMLGETKKYRKAGWNAYLHSH